MPKTLRHRDAVGHGGLVVEAENARWLAGLFQCSSNNELSVINPGVLLLIGRTQLIPLM